MQHGNTARHYRNSGFTLLELIIVMAILSVLAAIISSSFINSLKKGRDAQRKSDLEQTQRALELYYEDKGTYPTFDPSWGNKLCETSSCVAGEKVYMRKLPRDPVSGYNYYYVQTGSTYYLYSCIENSSDEGEGIDQDGYTTGCGCDTCRYKVSSSNAP